MELITAAITFAASAVLQTNYDFSVKSTAFTPLDAATALSATSGRGMVHRDTNGQMIVTASTPKGAETETVLLALLKTQGYDTKLVNGLWWSEPQRATNSVPWKQPTDARLKMWLVNETTIRSREYRVVAKLGNNSGTPNVLNQGVRSLLAASGMYGVMIKASEAIGIRAALEYLNTETDGRVVQRYEAMLHGSQSVTLTRAVDVRFLAGSTSIPAAGTIVTERKVDVVSSGLQIEVSRTEIDSEMQELFCHVTLSSLNSFDANGLPQTSRTESSNSVRLGRGDICKVAGFSARSQSKSREKIFFFFPAGVNKGQEDSYSLFAEIE